MQNNNNRKGLVLIGGGGHAQAVRDVIESLNGYSISLGGRVRIGLVIEDSRKLSRAEWDKVILGYGRFVLGVGQIKTAAPRIEIVEALTPRGGMFPTIISPRAYVSPTARIGQGTVIMHNAIVNAGAVIDPFCIINTGAIIEHNAKIGVFTHVSTEAVVNGGAGVGCRSFVGSNAVVLNQIAIGNDVILGAGSVACCDITEPGIYRGNPAGKVKKMEKI